MAKTQIEGSQERKASRGAADFGLDIPEGDGPLLTDRVVVESTLRSFFTEILDIRKAYNGGSVKGEDASAKIKAVAKRYAAIFMAEEPGYSFTDWNSPEQLGVFLSRTLGDQVKPEEAAEAYFLRLAADFVDQAVIPFEDDKIDMETAMFRMDAGVEDATFTLLGLQNSATENE